jgi:hypothetical protein
MPINFIDIKTNKKDFGICDSAPNSQEPAFLDFDISHRDIWVASVANYTKKEVMFSPIDKRLELKSDVMNMQKRCDALLYFTVQNRKSIIFVELKERTDSNWKKDGDNQLRETINAFEQTPQASEFKIKRAHIANNLRQKSNENDMPRIKRFKEETGYALTIEKTITIESQDDGQ